MTNPREPFRDRWPGVILRMLAPQLVVGAVLLAVAIYEWCVR